MSAMATPYIVFICACAILGGLLVLRHRLALQTTGISLYVNDTGLPMDSVQIGNGQTIGTRPEQDDYFASQTTSVGTLAVLADGISGLDHGRMASTLAVTTFMKDYEQVKEYRQIPDYMEEAAFASNREIVQQLKGNHGGTTLAAVVLTGRHLYWGAVGDSIITIFRNSSFIPVNSMHTFGAAVLQQKVLSGEMTRQQADSSPQRKQLVNYLGYEGFDHMEICDTPFVLRPGDKVLLCSDGIYDALTEVELEAILKVELTPQDAADRIIESIQQKQLKHQDNATVIIMEHGVSGR